MTTTVSKIPETLNAALAALQAKLPTVGKGETAQVVAKSGAKYSYSYADLAAIATTVYPLLSEVGLSFVARPTLTEYDYVLVGELRHASGEQVDGVFPLPDSRDPQTLGSAITYGRRYLLGCLSGVVTDEDDDGGRAHAAQNDRGSSRAARPPEQPEAPAADVDVEAVYNDYSTRMAQAGTREELAKLAAEVIADRRLTRAKSAALKQQYDARMGALSAADDAEAGAA